MGGTSIDDLFVSSPGGAMYRFDGTQWALSDSLLGWQYSFWVADSGRMITAGNNSVYSYDGAWNILLEGDFSMVAVAADERGHILCAGRNIVKYFDGTAWKGLPTPSVYLNDVSISPEEDLFLADTRGMYRWSGSKFERLTPPRSSDVIKIIGRDGQVLGFGLDNLVVYEAGIVSLQEARLYSPIVEGRDGNIYGTSGYGLSVWKQ